MNFRKQIKWTKNEIIIAMDGSKTYKETLQKLGVSSHRYWMVVLKELLQYHELKFYTNKCKSGEESLNIHRKAVRKYLDKLIFMRRNGIDVWRFIWEDTRRSDKKKGLANNLTKEFIRSQINDPCSYCGEKIIRMTLDRVDNQKGHLMDNVVPACVRCNYIRGNMPYKAWLCLLPGLKKAREDGLFGDWQGKTHNRIR